MSFPVSSLNQPNSSRKAQKSTENHGFLMSLPSQIMFEILSRVPPKSIIQCKCVCKKWLNLMVLIIDPYFITLHFSNSKPGLIVHQSEMFKNFFKLVDFNDASDHHNLVYDTILKFSLTSLSTFSDADIVVDGSINCFLFLRDINYKHETLFVCNPLTREYIQLPSPENIVRYPSVVTHGFGVTTMSREYKVVRVFHERELDPGTGACLSIPFSECQVYTLGTGAWRTVGEAPFAYDSGLIGLFFKGNLHWLIQDLEGYEMISCFDLENEFFQPFPPPFPGRKFQGSLGVLRDCLCLCDNTSHLEIDIWVMKEYGDEKSWGKDIIIKKMPELIGPSYKIVYALIFFENGNILLMWGDFFMFHYCSKSKASEEIDMEQTRGPNSIEAITYVPSFMNLRKLVMENVISF